MALVLLVLLIRRRKQSASGIPSSKINVQAQIANCFYGVVFNGELKTVCS